MIIIWDLYPYHVSSKEIKLDGEVGKLLEAARRERRALEKELNEVGHDK